MNKSTISIRKTDAFSTIFVDYIEGKIDVQAFYKYKPSITSFKQAIEDKSDSLTVQVTTDHPSWLVLADTYYSGWSATVDGVATDIQQANLMFRAVQVPAGAHEVQFEYHFRWMWAGILVSIASLLIVVVLFRSRETT